MKSGRMNIWLCKAFALILILNIFGIRQGFAQPKSVYFNTEALSDRYGHVRFERRVIDLLPDLLKKEGLTMDDFHYMMQKNVNALTEAEKAQLARIRNAMPKPDANTVMQKVIPTDDIELYVLGDYSGVRGSVSVASDTKHLKTFEDYYHGLRLDYEKTKFYLSKNSCGVIRFTSDEVPTNIFIPTSNDWEYPFTAHGFTSGNNGRLGVPEWNLVKEVDIKEGAEIWEVFNDGTEKLRAIYNGGKFNSIK